MLGVSSWNLRICRIAYRMQVSGLDEVLSSRERMKASLELQEFIYIKAMMAEAAGIIVKMPLTIMLWVSPIP